MWAKPTATEVAHTDAQEQPQVAPSRRKPSLPPCGGGYISPTEKLYCAWRRGYSRTAIFFLLRKKAVAGIYTACFSTGQGAWLLAECRARSSAGCRRSPPQRKLRTRTHKSNRRLRPHGVSRRCPLRGQVYFSYGEVILRLAARLCSYGYIFLLRKKAEVGIYTAYL